MHRLVLLLATEVALVVAAQRAAAPHRARVLGDPVGVLGAEAGDLLVLLLHLGAWLAAWWLLLGTVHDAVAAWRTRLRRRGAPAPPRRRLAPRWVQRVVQQAVGTALVVGLASGPAAAAMGGPQDVAAVVVAPPVPVIADVEGARPPAEEVDPGHDAGAPDGGGAGDADEAVGPGPAAGTHVVASGENLWVIARAHLMAHGHDAPDDRTVHAHWVELIQLNRDGLRSGDPDLVLPGEVLDLPAVPGADRGSG